MITLLSYYPWHDVLDQIWGDLPAHLRRSPAFLREYEAAREELPARL